MTHQNSSNYNKETKRYVSLQVEEKTPRVGERKKKEVLSFGQLLSVALVQRRLLWWNWGFACKPHDTSRAQQNREVDHRSNWPQENRKKKDVFLGCKTSRKRACFMSILNVIKKKCCSKYVAILCSQYCRGTLTVLLLPDDIKTLITHFDQSDWEMTPDHIWWRMFHGM